MPEELFATVVEPIGGTVADPSPRSGRSSFDWATRITITIFVVENFGPKGPGWTYGFLTSLVPLWLGSLLYKYWPPIDAWAQRRGWGRSRLAGIFSVLLFASVAVWIHFYPSPTREKVIGGVLGTFFPAGRVDEREPAPSKPPTRVTLPQPGPAAPAQPPAPPTLSDAEIDRRVAAALERILGRVRLPGTPTQPQPRPTGTPAPTEATTAASATPEPPPPLVRPNLPPGVTNPCVAERNTTNFRPLEQALDEAFRLRQDYVATRGDAESTRAMVNFGNNSIQSILSANVGPACVAPYQRAAPVAGPLDQVPPDFPADKEGPLRKFDGQAAHLQTLINVLREQQQKK